MDGPTATVAAVRRLNARRLKAHTTANDLDDQFARAVLTLREQGWSVRLLAAELGLGASTIQDWTRRGRALKD